jgi:galactokinase
VTFEALYGSQPTVAAESPGRVNLIGEHTDYNDGFVLPAALPLRTRVELAPRSGRDVRAWSTAFPGEPVRTLPLDVTTAAGDWADYVRGMVWALEGHRLDRGFDIRVESSVPVGSGLSSSAALLIAVGRAMREAFALSLDDMQLALLAKKAETEFVGAPVGIMDQMACSLADEAGALFIDTRTLHYVRVPLPAHAELLVVDSGVRHSHASGDYRVRRAECHRAAELLGVPSLRDVNNDNLSRIEKLPGPLNRRARHVVTENARVVAAVEALRSGDLSEVGRLFSASHVSLRDDFEVSVPAVDALVDGVRSMNGVYGARLTGGGFGGAIVALTRRGIARATGEAVIVEHNRRFPNRAAIVVP